MLARLIIIGFGIAIIFPALIYNGVTSAYPAPKRNDYFPLHELPLSLNAPAEERKARADIQQERQKAFDEASRRFARVLLIVATVCGVAAILIGSLISLPETSAGLMLGGIFSVGIGYWQYSICVDDWCRFTSLLICLTVLLFVGYRQHPGIAPGK